MMLRYLVGPGTTRRRKDGTKPIVWQVRENTAAATLVAVFPDEDSAVRYAKHENQSLADPHACLEVMWFNFIPGGPKVLLDKKSVDSVSSNRYHHPIMKTFTEFNTNLADDGGIAPTPIQVGNKLKIVKGVVRGSVSRDIVKGTTAQVRAIEELGADYGHAVKVTFVMLNGYNAGKTFSFYVRHKNRLADTLINMNDGNPNHKIQVRSVA